MKHHSMSQRFQDSKSSSHRSNNPRHWPCTPQVVETEKEEVKVEEEEVETEVEVEEKEEEKEGMGQNSQRFDKVRSLTG